VNHDADILTVIFVFVGVITSIGCFTGIVTTWIKYRAKRVVSADLTVRLGEIADRMAKLDNAVDAMAVEVERISEGQRFVTKVLAERGTTPALPDAARAGGSTPRH
jgi:predicted TPR repeat methyltransferase